MLVGSYRMRIAPININNTNCWSWLCLIRNYHTLLLQRSLKRGRHYLNYNYSMLVLIKCCFVICWVSVKEIKRVGNFSNYTIYNKGHYINFYFFLHSLKSVLTLHSLKTVFPFWWRLMKLHTAFLLLHVRIIKYLCVKTEYMVAMDDLPDVRDHRWSQHFLKTEE